MKSNISQFILFAIKLVLGVTFIYASYYKINEPAAFAKVLYGYDLFPQVSINILAIVIPFIELVAGFCLIFGLFPRSALAILNVLLLGFILAIGFNLARGHEFECGCFALKDGNSTTSNINLLIRDILLFAAGIYYWIKTKAPGKNKISPLRRWFYP